MATKKDVEAQERAGAIKELRKLLRPGSTVYTVLRHVSASGMTRCIDLFTIRKGGIRHLTRQASEILGYKRDYARGGFVVSGCGMDMGFEVVYNLGRALFPKGFIPAKAGIWGRNGTPATERDTDGGYALRHTWV